MKKLELKQAVNYLPYKVWFKINNNKLLCKGISNIKKTWYLNAKGGVYYIGDCKLILRPLSDLNKPIDENEPDVSFYDWITSEYDFNIRMFIKSLDIERLPYEVVEYFFEHHFDVSGLIEKGLAIDINTLK